MGGGLDEYIKNLLKKILKKYYQFYQTCNFFSYVCTYWSYYYFFKIKNIKNYYFNYLRINQIIYLIVGCIIILI